MLLFALTALHLSARAAGWVEIGPERGHVVDAAVGPSEVLVATRVGVVSAPLTLEGWKRDARFPNDTRRLAVGPDGVGWAASPGSLWRVDGAEPTRIWTTSNNSSAVDLEALDGAMVAAVRGDERGVYRADASGVSRVLEADAFCLAVSGQRVLAGTLDKGAFLSEDGGRTFTLYSEGKVSAVAFVGDTPWVGLMDGHILAGKEPKGQLTGWPRAIVGTGEGVLVVESGNRDAVRLDQGEGLRDLTLQSPDIDQGPLNWTGAWALPDGDALLGTFRRGPIRYADGALNHARQGFRYGVGAGAAIDEKGRMLVAFMGTGVYATTDQGKSWTPVHSSETVVTDSVDVIPVREGIAALDFDGAALWRSDGTWTRYAGAGHGHDARSSFLNELGQGPDGTWWAMDQQGRLWQLVDGTWRGCATYGGKHLSDRGEDLRLLTMDAALMPGSCDAPWTRDPAAPRLSGMETAADGGCYASPGALYCDGELRAELPREQVVALSMRGKEALVGTRDGLILRCTTTCTALNRLDGEPRELGWFPDGTPWVQERGGTLLAWGDGTPRPAWKRRFGSAGRVDVSALEDPSGRGGGGGPRPGPQQANPNANPPARVNPEAKPAPSAPVTKPPKPHHATIYVLLAFGATAAAGWLAGRRRRR